MMLKMEHVQKIYQGFRLDCTLEVPEGSVTGLIGTNGAGKTTTFKAALGLLHPDEGSIRLFGKPEASKAEKERLGVVLSDSGFSGWLYLKDIAPILKQLYQDFDEDYFLRQCRHFGLPLEKKIKDLSTGMKAKLKVLTAVSHKADFLILDEPTAGLDVLARNEILDLLREYMIPKGRSILISSHISGDLENLCDDFYLIDQGKIIMHEETDVLLSDYGLLKATEEQYEALDKAYLLRKKKETYGYSLLTSQKQFYLENYPQIALEKGSIDSVIEMMIQGERV